MSNFFESVHTMKLIVKTIFTTLLLFGYQNSIYAQTIKIGSHEWMTENLNVERFRNGDLIPEAKTRKEWENASIWEKPAWCHLENDPGGKKYGKLYNWYAVTDPRGLAPYGYHIPTRAEWQRLDDFIGGNSSLIKNTQGWGAYRPPVWGVVVCSNCANWNNEYRSKVACHVCKDTRRVKDLIDGPLKSANGSNSTGFSALSHGHRGSSGFFHSTPHWWSSTVDYYEPYYFSINNTESTWLNRSSAGNGCSVRCIKDAFNPKQKTSTGTSGSKYFDNRVATLLPHLDFYDGSGTSLNYENNEALNYVSSSIYWLEEQGKVNNDNLDDWVVKYMLRYFIKKKMKYPFKFSYDPKIFDISFDEVRGGTSATNKEKDDLNKGISIIEEGFVQYEPGTAQWRIVKPKRGSFDWDRVTSDYIRKTQKPIEEIQFRQTKSRE